MPGRLPGHCQVTCHPTQTQQVSPVAHPKLPTAPSHHSMAGPQPARLVPMPISLHRVRHPGRASAWLPLRCAALRSARHHAAAPPPPCARVPELLLLDVALVLLVSARLAVALHHHLCLGGAEVLVQVHGPDGTAGVGLQSDVIGDGCRRAAAGQGRERERV